MSARSWTAGHPFDAGMTVPVFDRCLETVSQAHPRPGPSRSRKLRPQPMCGWTYCAPRPRRSVVEMQVLRLPASGLFATMLGSADCRGGPGGLFGLSLPTEYRAGEPNGHA